MHMQALRGMHPRQVLGAQLSLGEEREKRMYLLPARQVFAGLRVEGVRAVPIRQIQCRSLPALMHSVQLAEMDSQAAWTGELH